MIARWQETAALRNLNLAFVRCGSFATEALEALRPLDVRFAPKADAIQPIGLK